MQCARRSSSTQPVTASDLALSSAVDRMVAAAQQDADEGLYVEMSQSDQVRAIWTRGSWTGVSPIWSRGGTGSISTTSAHGGPRILAGTPRHANNGNRNVARYTPGLQTNGGSVSIYIQTDRPGIRSRLPDWGTYPPDTVLRANGPRATPMLRSASELMPRRASGGAGPPVCPAAVDRER